MRRAENFVEQLRGPCGSRDVTGQLPSCGTERSCISQDTKLKTVRTEVHTKKVKDVLSWLYPEHMFYGQRRGGVVAVRYKPVVKLGAWDDNTTLLFNEAALRELEIDKSEVLRAWGGGGDSLTGGGIAFSVAARCW